MFAEWLVFMLQTIAHCGCVSGGGASWKVNLPQGYSMSQLKKRRGPPRSEESSSGETVSSGEGDAKPISSPPPPSLDGAPRYFISFTAAASEEIIQHIVKWLEGAGLECELLRENSCRSVTVSGKLEVLAKEAEREHWMKQLKNSEELLEFKVQNMDDYEPSRNAKMFVSAEEVQLLCRAIENASFQPKVFKDLKVNVPSGKGLLSTLLESSPRLVEENFPLHDPHELTFLSRMLRRSFIPFTGIKVDLIRDYFGEDMAFYFAWMNFYSTCILVPAMVGVVMYLARGASTTVDTDAYLPFYSVFIALWAILFLVFWQRRSSVHSFHWNTHTYCTLDEIHHTYHGTVSIDPVTDQPTVYYPAWKRRLWYVFSFLLMLPLLSVGVAIMTLSLNLNGYVRDKHSPIYVGWLARYAEPGGIFAGDSPYYLWLVPTLGHSIIVNVVNQIYSSIARWCTDLENHRTVREWHSALVVKRVFFECFDCFMPLLYIAFYQLDVVTLRAEIVSLFMSDEIRRVTVECVVPMVTGTCMKRKHNLKYEDTLLAEYDQFDDYLEMVIQFGYITLFASAFPLGATVTMLFIYIELRSDVFKLLYAYRRPMPLK